MTQGPIGEAHVLISPDLRAFAAKLKAELDATFARMRDPEVNVEATLDRGSLRRVIAEAKAAGRAAKVKVDVDVDRDKIRGATRDFNLLGRQGKSALRSLNQEVFHSNIRLREMANILGGATLPVLASLASVGVAAFTSLGAAAVGAAAAIAVLPGLIAAAVQAVGVSALAFGGLGAALKAMGASQAAAGRAAATGAKQQATAARQQAAAAETQRRAAESVADAQRGLNRIQQDGARAAIDALRSIRSAQEDLTRARREALDNLKDLHLEERGLALSQEEAKLRIVEAQQELNKVLADPAATNLEKQRASLRLRQAQLDRDETVRRIELNKREIKQGVEGAGAVVTARERVTDAQRAAARSAKDSSQQIADAQRTVTRALRDQAASARSAGLAATAAVPAVDKLGQAMANLSPAGQRFAKFLFSLKPRFLELRGLAQAGLFPGLETAITRLVNAHFPALRRIVDATARTLGDLADEGSKMMSSGPWRKDFETIGRQNVRLIDQFGHVGLNLADAFRNLIVAAAPLTRLIGTMTLRWSENVKGAAAAGRESGKLGKFFTQAGDALQSLLRIAGNVGATLGAIFTAAFPSGAGLLTSLEGATDKMRELATSTAGGTALRDFFDKARPAAETIGRLVASLARNIFEVAVHLKSATERIAEFLDEHPELAEMVTQMAALALAMKALNVAGLLGVVGSIGQLAVSAGPLGLVAAALLAIGGAIAFAYFNNKPFRDSVDDLGRKIRDTVLPALRSFGDFIKEKVIPALKEAIPFIKDQLVAGLDFLFQAIEDNKPQLKLFGRILLEVGKFIAVTLIPALFKLWSVHLRALFTALGVAVGAVGLLGRVFVIFVKAILTGFGAILDAAVSAFGWMPGIGGKLKDAQKSFRKFREDVNTELDKLKDRNVTVKARASVDINKSVALYLKTTGGPGFHARGGPIFGPGTGTSDSIPAWLSHGEHVWTAAEVRKAGGHSVMEAWRRIIRGFAAGGPVVRAPIPRFAAGGGVGDAGDARGVRVTAFGSISPLEQGVARFGRALDAVAAVMASALDRALGGLGSISGRAGKVLDFLKAQLGEPYLWGGTGPDRWDCSGLMLKAFGSVGVRLPRVAADQQYAGRAVSRAAARLGDLIYFGNPAHHIGFYLGNDTMLHAPHTGDVVKISKGRVGTGYRRVMDRGGYLMPGINVVENRTGRPELVPGPGRDHVGRAVSAGYGQGMHVENLIVQPLSGRFRLADVLTELALQGVR